MGLDSLLMQPLINQAFENNPVGQSIVSTVLSSDGGRGAGPMGGPRAPMNEDSAYYKLMAKRMAKRYGWTGDDWQSLKWLWGTKESGWNPEAANPNSSARGIPQAMMSVHFGDDWQHNPDAQRFLHDPRYQIRWGLDYIKNRYGSPSAAQAGYYGGNLGGPTGY